MTLGPHTKLRRKLHLARVVFWLLNAPFSVWLVLTQAPTVYLPYLTLISVAANIEGAWSSYAADSPLDE